MECGPKKAPMAIPSLRSTSIASISNQDRLKQASLLIQHKNPAESSIKTEIEGMIKINPNSIDNGIIIMPVIVHVT